MHKYLFVLTYTYVSILLFVQQIHRMILSIYFKPLGDYTLKVRLAVEHGVSWCIGVEQGLETGRAVFGPVEHQVDLSSINWNRSSIKWSDRASFGPKKFGNPNLEVKKSILPYRHCILKVIIYLPKFTGNILVPI